MRYWLSTLLLFSGPFLFAQVGVGTETPNVNTILELQSNSKGVLIPRMTALERDANLADNDPDTDYPNSNTPALNPIPSNPEDFLKEGTMIYNTDVKAIQYWDADAERWTSVMAPPGFATGNDGTVLMNFPEFGEPNAYTINLTERLLNSYEWNVTKTEYDQGGNVVNVNNAFLLQEDESVFGSEVQAAFDDTDFDIAPAPVTRWPDNAVDRTKTGIWDNTNKTLIENKIEGQVHFWRVVIQYQVASGNAQKGSILARIDNPNQSSTFETSNTTAIVDGNAGAIATSTFLFVTVADNLSLPNLNNGGIGYELFFSSNNDITITLRSILRISIFKD
ncbi:MAG: hypothetical protein N4A46_11675 [Schleiferiaceae bacterium]|jgi:hypothetical protein|nr:hypothetical protein [Schleiferiaceae bacterium]